MSVPTGSQGTTAAPSARQMAAAPGLEVRAVLFDLDKTLLGRDKVVVSWVIAFAQAYLLLPLTRLDNGPCPHGAIGALQRLPRRAVARVAQRADTLLRRRVTLDAPAERLLGALRRAGVPFGIVTNGRRHRRETVRALGLEEATGCILISRERERGKPQQDIFLAAADCLHVPAARILFVGDKPRTDMQGARDAGMKTAWLRRGRRWPARKSGSAPDLTLDSLDSLTRLLGL